MAYTWCSSIYFYGEFGFAVLFVGVLITAIGDKDGVDENKPREAFHSFGRLY